LSLPAAIPTRRKAGNGLYDNLFDRKWHAILVRKTTTLCVKHDSNCPRRDSNQGHLNISVFLWRIYPTHHCCLKRKATSGTLHHLTFRSIVYYLS
jgi:hypothetical protein